MILIKTGIRFMGKVKVFVIYNKTGKNFHLMVSFFRMISFLLFISNIELGDNCLFLYFKKAQNFACRGFCKLL